MRKSTDHEAILERIYQNALKQAKTKKNMKDVVYNSFILGIFWERTRMRGFIHAILRGEINDTRKADRIFRKAMELDNPIVSGDDAPDGLSGKHRG